jgi:hypothetical protein
LGNDHLLSGEIISELLTFEERKVLNLDKLD